MLYKYEYANQIEILSMIICKHATVDGNKKKNQSCIRRYKCKQSKNDNVQMKQMMQLGTPVRLQVWITVTQEFQHWRCMGDIFEETNWET